MEGLICREYRHSAGKIIKTFNLFYVIKQILIKFSKGSLAKDAGLYMVFSILDKLVPFIVLPIISRELSVEAMGFYILFQSIYNFVLPILTLNADSGIMLNHYHLDKDLFKRYFSSGLFVFFISFTVVTIVTFLFRGVIEKLLSFDIEFLFLAYVIGFFYFFNSINLNIWQKEKKPVSYGVFTILLTLLKNILILIFVFYFPEFSWKGIIISQVIAQFVFFLYSVFFLKKKGLINTRFDKKYMLDVLNLGVPVTVHQLGAWSGNLGSRLVVNSLIGTVAAGHFGIGTTFGAIMTIVQTSFNKAFVPYLYERLKGIQDDDNEEKIKHKKEKLVKMTYLYNISLVGLALIISFIGYYGVDIIFGEKYYESRVFIFWVVFASAFNGMYKMHVAYMFYNKKTKHIASITLSTGIINLLLCIFIISINGKQAVGAAQALLISQFMSYILSWYMADRVYPLPWFNRLIK